MRLLAGIMAAATLAAPQLHFPRDHYGHRAGIEWWYFTADVHGSDGHRYAVFFTLFKSAGFVVPVSQVVNLDSGRIVRHTENLARASGLPFSSKVAGLRYEPGKDDWVARVEAPRYALRFTAHPQKPYVLHGGGTGVVEQGTGLSRYYSATRMTISGSVGAVPFTGEAWFDHQWGNFQSNRTALRWDWFSCRFDDRTELMLYRFRSGGESGTRVDRAGHGRLVSGFRAVAGKRSLRAAGRRWPLDWTLRVGSEHLVERLHAVVPDQLVRGALLPTFWEGAAVASGTKRGVCFVEETG